jgi:hypothetical protein
MTNEELRDGLIRLAKRMGLSIMEIDHMAKMVVQADHDPLSPEDWGDRFDFDKRKLTVFDLDDFSCITPEVPKPDAEVDLRKAWIEFGRDISNINRILSQNPDLPIAKQWLVFLNQWDWFRFWSVRHPSPEARAKFAQGLAQGDAAAGDVADKANARLRQRGIEMMKPRKE